jgi:spore germination cell wall hydrolase CwlJ-like protein
MAGVMNKFKQAANPLKVDKRFYDMIFAESGGGIPEEINATASVYLNRLRELGLEKALLGSTAYRKKSKQYRKASEGVMNAFDQKIWGRNKALIDNLIQNPATISPYWFQENVNAFGEPPWLNETSGYKDIGRQRFYIKK